MDEAYVEFLAEAQDLLPLILPGKKTNLILLRTFSSIYGLAGLRLGHDAIAHPGIHRRAGKNPPALQRQLHGAGRRTGQPWMTSPMSAKTRLNNARGKALLEREVLGFGPGVCSVSGQFHPRPSGSGPVGFRAIAAPGGSSFGQWVVINCPNGFCVSVGTPAENRRCLAALRRKSRAPMNA